MEEAEPNIFQGENTAVTQQLRKCPLTAELSTWERKTFILQARSRPSKSFWPQSREMSLLILRELILFQQGKFPVLSRVSYLSSFKPTYSLPDLTLLGFPLLFSQAGIVHLSPWFAFRFDNPIFFAV